MTTLPEQPLVSPMFDRLGLWLMESGLREAGEEELVQGFGRRLTEAGVSLYRVSLGGMLLHPVFGALDVVWNASTDTVVSQMMPRGVVTTPDFQDSPFFWAILNKVEFHRFALGNGAMEPEFPIFERLRGEGVTDYLLFYESYGRTDDMLWADLPSGMEGITLSLSTRRIGGFSDFEINYLRALMRPFALSVKSLTTHSLARALLDTYLGKYSGKRVLNGMVERGDGGMIDCVLFYCDLRESTRLAEAMTPQQYLALINDYFDCTAGAIVDHGGEVLKFIGDAVLAIFPIHEGERPAADMCRAAITAAGEAFARAAALTSDHGGDVKFGISLHVGQVMYGNVGTERRLDFTVIGPSVNQATRLEGLCKTIGTPLVISDSFRAGHEGELFALGRHALAGVVNEIEIYTLPELAPTLTE